MVDSHADPARNSHVTRRIVIRNLFFCSLIIIGVGGIFGVLIGLIGFILVTFFIPMIALSKVKNHFEIDDVILFIDIVTLGARSGLSPQSALRMHGHLLHESAQVSVLELLTRCDAGMSWRDSLKIFFNNNEMLVPVISILIRSDQSGAPIIDTLQKVRHTMWRKHESEHIQKIKSVAVRCVFPLGICFLPAFVILTIIPIIASLLPKVFLSF